jgi:hypothetical protein
VPAEIADGIVRIPREVIVDKHEHRHALPEQLGRQCVGVDLIVAVNDYPIQLFGPGVHLLSVTQAGAQ